MFLSAHNMHFALTAMEASYSRNMSRRSHPSNISLFPIYHFTSWNLSIIWNYIDWKCHFSHLVIGFRCESCDPSKPREGAAFFRVIEKFTRFLPSISLSLSFLPASYHHRAQSGEIRARQVWQEGAVQVRQEGSVKVRSPVVCWPCIMIPMEMRDTSAAAITEHTRWTWWSATDLCW